MDPRFADFEERIRALEEAVFKKADKPAKRTAPVKVATKREKK